MPRSAQPPSLADFVNDPRAATENEADASSFRGLDEVDPYALPSRASRDAQSREAEARPGTYDPNEIFPTPPAKPGVRYRWVVYQIYGSQEGTAANLMRRYREGWNPVDPATLPESYLRQVRGINRAMTEGRVEIGGQILCEISEHDAQSLDARLRDANRRFLDREAEDKQKFRASAHRDMPVYDEREFRMTRSAE